MGQNLHANMEGFRRVSHIYSSYLNEEILMNSVTNPKLTIGKNFPNDLNQLILYSYSYIAANLTGS